MASSRHEVDEATRLTELRVIATQQTAELARLRVELAPLVGMPAQLDALSQLWQEQLKNLHEKHDRDVRELRADIEQLASWQTWALRLVVGAIVLATIALLGLPVT